MGDLDQEILKYVIGELDEGSIPASKIVVQKLLFYLRETGVPLTYSFEPYLYGPYSKELAKDASELAYWDEIEYHDEEYTPGEDFEYELDEDISSLIDRGINEFAGIVGEDFDFDSMELFGTVLYCIKALKDIGADTSFQSVLEEFKEWKGEKYEDYTVEKTYSAIQART